MIKCLTLIVDLNNEIFEIICIGFYYKRLFRNFFFFFMIDKTLNPGINVIPMDTSIKSRIKFIFCACSGNANNFIISN